LDAELENISAEPVELVICGGAAMAWRNPERLSVDVDVVSEGVTLAVRRAAESVSERFGVDRGWVNDAAKKMPARRSGFASSICWVICWIRTLWFSAARRRSFQWQPLGCRTCATPARRART